ncbi:MAG: hypothetical protein ACE5IJ_09195, partial [Thermoplasmata archaeon]
HFNPPLEMKRVGLTDEFACEVSLPEVDGKMHYFIIAQDAWGNVAYSGNETSPHAVSVTGAPIEWGPILLWGPIFVVIGLVYLGIFVRFRRQRGKADEEEIEEETEE